MKLSLAILAFASAGSVGAAVEPESIKIDSRIPFADPAGVPQAVREECRLESNLPKLLMDQARSSVDVREESGGKVFHARIVQVVDPGLSVWSGRGSIAVEGELFDHGMMMGSVFARSKTGLFGGDPCGMLNFSARVVAKRIAEWLVTPSMGARFED